MAGSNPRSLVRRSTRQVRRVLVILGISAAIAAAGGVPAVAGERGTATTGEVVASPAPSADPAAAEEPLAVGAADNATPSPEPNLTAAASTMPPAAEPVQPAAPDAPALDEHEDAEAGTSGPATATSPEPQPDEPEDSTPGPTAAPTMTPEPETTVTLEPAGDDPATTQTAPCPPGFDGECTEIRLVKNSDADPVATGGRIGYSLRVINRGPHAATGVRIDDPLPDGFAWQIDSPETGCTLEGATLRCDGGDLAVRASFRAHVSAPVPDGVCGKVINRAGASATNARPVTNRDSVTILCPGLDILKTADTATVTAGNRMGFLVTVTNTGDAAATGVTMADTLPAGPGVAWVIDGGNAAGSCTILEGVVRCSFGDISPGGAATVHVSSATTNASCRDYDNTAVTQATNIAGSRSASASLRVTSCVFGVRLARTGTGLAGWPVGTGLVAAGFALVFAGRRKDRAAAA